MKYYLCPVCGYNQITRPPEDFYICPCCGTEFEADDFDKTYDELRLEWKERGMDWFSRYTKPPIGWNPLQQLENLGISISQNSYTYEIRKTEIFIGAYAGYGLDISFQNA